MTTLEMKLFAFCVALDFPTITSYVTPTYTEVMVGTEWFVAGEIIEVPQDGKKLTWGLDEKTVLNSSEYNEYIYNLAKNKFEVEIEPLFVQINKYDKELAISRLCDRLYQEHKARAIKVNASTFFVF